MDFGRWCRQQREARGWSQAGVARRVGVTRSQMNNIEAGRSRAGTEVLAQLMALYDATPADLLKQEEVAQVEHQEAPDHPGVRELAASRELSERHHVTPAELQELAALILLRQGQPVTLHTAQDALAALQTLRMLGPA